MSAKPKPSWQIYKEEMEVLCHGDALWQPAPTPDYDCVHIGDVGYIREGRFVRLFSACSPPQEVINYTGESVLPQSVVEEREPRAPGCLHTATVKMIGPFTGCRLITPLPDDSFTFELTGDHGAALVTTHATYRKDSLHQSTFQTHIKKNYLSWIRFAHDQQMLMDDGYLILVTGFDVTKDFSMVSYQHGPSGISFETGITARERMFHSTSSDSLGWWRFGREPYSNDGSSDTYNQCVFIRYYTMRHRRFPFPFPKVLTSLGDHFDSAGNGGGSVPGPVPKPDDKSTTGDKGNLGGHLDSITGGADPEKTTNDQTTQYEKEPDDWDVIADYVFRNSDAVSVLLHHRDLAGIRKAGCTDDLSTLLARHKPHIVVDADGVGRITNSASQGLDHLDAPVHSFHDQVDNTLCSQEYDECLDRIRDANTILPTSETSCQGAVIRSPLKHLSTLPLFGMITSPLRLVSDWISGGFLPDYTTKAPEEHPSALGFYRFHSCNAISAIPESVGDYPGSHFITALSPYRVTTHKDSNVNVP